MYGADTDKLIIPVTYLDAYQSLEELEEVRLGIRVEEEHQAAYQEVSYLYNKYWYNKQDTINKYYII